MSWWWAAFRVETRFQVIKFFLKCVLVVIENLDSYYVQTSSTLKDLQFDYTIFLVSPQRLTVETDYFSVYMLQWLFV